MTTSFSDHRNVEQSRSSARLAAPHSIELEVQRRIYAQPGINVRSLVVRRTPSGVCLEGHLEVEDGAINLPELLAGIVGLGEVVDHLSVNSVDSAEAELLPEPADPLDRIEERSEGKASTRQLRSR